MEFNIFDSLFSHDPRGSSCANRPGKFICFRHRHHNESLDTFYTENHLDLVFQHTDRPGKKYAWLIESKDIKPTELDKVVSNLSKYTAVYDKIFTNCDDLIRMNPDKCKWVTIGGVTGTYTYPSTWDRKTKMVSCIASNKRGCAGHIDRLEYVMKHRHKFDLYGRGIRNIRSVNEGLNDYMFSVVIENAQYKTYFSEKILNCFATGTVPIYRGCPNIGEFFDMNGIILLSDDFDFTTLTRALYDSMRDAVRTNYERCKQYEVAEDYIYTNYLVNM